MESLCGARSRGCLYPRFDSFFRRKNNTQELSAAESTAEAGE